MPVIRRNEALGIRAALHALRHLRASGLSLPIWPLARPPSTDLAIVSLPHQRERQALCEPRLAGARRPLKDEVLPGQKAFDQAFHFSAFEESGSCSSSGTAASSSVPPPASSGGGTPSVSWNSVQHPSSITSVTVYVSTESGSCSSSGTAASSSVPPPASSGGGTPSVSWNSVQRKRWPSRPDPYRPRQRGSLRKRRRNAVTMHGIHCALDAREERGASLSHRRPGGRRGRARSARP